MKQINFIKVLCTNLLFMLLIGMLATCREYERGLLPTDKIQPKQVSNVVVENVPGGAIIRYTVPDDDDLLYVKVIYAMSDGTIVEQKSSVYNQQIVVEGLGRSNRQTVQMICGDRSGNESAPYMVEIEPLDSPIYEILESVKMTSDFGGIKITWDNPLQENIVMTLYTEDDNNRLVEVQNVYSMSSAGTYNMRGYPPEETTFAVSVRDRWENTTDKMSGTFTPYFEEQLDRFKFTRWNPPTIPYPEVYGGWNIELIWDGSFYPPFMSGATVILPFSITFNLGQTALLSRIKIFQNFGTENEYFNFYNVKKFLLYGSSHSNVTDDFGTWIFLGEFTSQKPSGLPTGQLSQEDIAYGDAGEDYIIETEDNEPVQYIRIHILENWGGGINYAQFAEMEFFGEIKHSE